MNLGLAIDMRGLGCLEGELYVVTLLSPLEDRHTPQGKCLPYAWSTGVDLLKRLMQRGTPATQLGTGLQRSKL